MHSTFAVKVCPSDWRIENLVHRLSLQLSGLFHSDLHAHVVYSPPLLTSPRSRVKAVFSLYPPIPLDPPIPLAPVYGWDGSACSSAIGRLVATRWQKFLFSVFFTSWERHLWCCYLLQEGLYISDHKRKSTRHKRSQLDKKTHPNVWLKAVLVLLN